MIAWSFALAAFARADEPREEFVPGHVLVHFRGGLPGRRSGEISRTTSARLERTLGAGTELLRADDPSEQGTRALIARLAADPQVAWIEREHIRRRSDAVVANDLYFKQQWSLAMARIPAAWSRTEGSHAVVVAVVDSGIRPHPDLESRYVGGYDFISDLSNAGDGDGRDADPTDVGTPDPNSSALHGMHVTGILGAHTDNTIGIAGVDWNCRIVPVRVLGIQGGQGSDSDIADGIRWAAGIPVAGAPENPNPASVINLSFGGPGGSNTLQAAVDEVDALGVIVVAAAGNDGADTAGYAPAGLNHVIAVGAVDDRGKLASYSNRGDRVDLMAPGGDLAAGPDHGILSTLWSPTDGFIYVSYNGTSQAAPHVSGVAALMKALDPTLSAERARAILFQTADPANRCMEGCGGGLLDADAALGAVALSCADGHCAVAGTSVFGGCSLSPGARPANSANFSFLLAAGLAIALFFLARRTTYRRAGA